MASGQIVFELPQPIRDWIFDVQDATRRALRSSEVAPLYETQFKDLTDRFFPSSPWPAAQEIAPECNYDEDFLLFYKEIRTRHLFTLQYASKDAKLKLSLTDFINSWTTYSKVRLVAPVGSSRLVSSCAAPLTHTHTHPHPHPHPPPHTHTTLHSLPTDFRVRPVQARH